MAGVHEQTGDYAIALQLAEESLALAEGLSAADPANIQMQQDVAATRALVERLRGRQSGDQGEPR
jgi:hypothetical protein